MHIIKNIFTYSIWIALAFFIGMMYARVLINPNEVPREGLSYLLHLFFKIGMIQVGLWVGASISLSFLLTDIFYLKKKLENIPKKTSYRLILLLIITLFVAITHYILEKVLDII